MTKALASTLILIWGTLLVQPLFEDFSKQLSKTSCSQRALVKSACSKGKCDAPKPSKDNKDCDGSRCNPLMACPTGNFFLFGYLHLSISPISEPREKTILANDNRISKPISECWHPPEIVS